MFCVIGWGKSRFDVLGCFFIRGFWVWKFELRIRIFWIWWVCCMILRFCFVVLLKGFF